MSHILDFIGNVYFTLGAAEKVLYLCRYDQGTGNREQGMTEQNNSLITEADLRAWNRLKTPIWILDLENQKIWWANKSALPLWQANSLESLLDREWKQISASTRERLERYIEQLKAGESFREQWTLYPQGKPLIMDCTCSGVKLDFGQVGMFVEGKSILDCPLDGNNNLKALEAFRNSRALIFIYDLDGNLILQNSTAQTYYNSDQNLADHFTEPFSWVQMLECLEQKEVYNLEAEVNTKQGRKWHYLEISYTDDPVTGDRLLIVTETDISHRKNLQGKYQQTSEQLEAVINAIPGLVSWVDDHCRYLGVNDYLAKTFHRHKEDFIGKTPGSLTGNQELMASLENFFKSDNTQMKQEIVSELEGETHSYLLVTQKYQNGKAAVSVGIDITGRKQAEKELQTQLQQSLLLKHITNKIRSNLKREEIFTTAADQIGKAFQVSRCLIFSYQSDLLRLPIVAEYLAPNSQAVSENYEGLDLANNEALQPILKTDRAFVFPNKKSFSVFSNLENQSELVIRTSYQGKPNGVIILQQSDSYRIWRKEEIEFLENIAAQLGIALAQAQLLEKEKAQRKALEKAKQEAEAANQSKSEFLAMMSHEIRTPLNSVLGLTELLLETHINREQKDYLNTIRASSDTLLTIIQDILDFSKIEAGHIDLENNPFDLRLCIEETLEMLVHKALSKEINLAYQIFPDTPTNLKGDINRLRQILLNLLGNAVKFTDRGEVTISVSNIAYGKQTKLLFAITDTGMGISQKQRERLFKPFSQGDASTTRRYGGTGLGLVISKRLIEAMGGKIWVESEVGKGTTFFFTIHTQITSQKLDRNWYQKQSEFTEKRLLIYCQDATNRAIITQYATSWGMKVYETDRLNQVQKWQGEGIDFDLAVVDRKIETRSEPMILLEGKQSLTKSNKISLSLPIKPATLDRAFRQALNLNVTSQTTTNQTTSSPTVDHALNILLVEDNIVNQKVAKKMLQRLGYEVVVANNGKEALTQLEKADYDLVFMDVQMPEMDGLEATQKIRQQFKAARQPYIIAMTANVMPGDRESCLEAGMNDYLTKPLKLQKIQDAITSVITN